MSSPDDFERLETQSHDGGGVGDDDDDDDDEDDVIDEKVSSIHQVSPENRGRAGFQEYIRRLLWPWRNAWLFEFASWTMSFILYLAIVWILSVYNDHKPLDLPDNFQLNAIIGLIASIANALMIAPVASAIGQFKWLHFRRNRSLHDFYAFDNASRGPSGSISLIFSRRGAGFASIVAACVICLMLFTSAFVQLTLRTYVAYSFSEDGTGMPYAQTFGGNETEPSPINSGVTWHNMTPGTLAAAYNGVFASSGQGFNVTTSCLTGNCSWPSYYTLAFTNDCTDLSHLLKGGQPIAADVGNPVENFTVQHSLPNGFSIAHPTATSFSLLNISATQVSPYFGGEGDRKDEQLYPWPASTNPSIAGSNSRSVVISLVVIGNIWSIPYEGTITEAKRGDDSAAQSQPSIQTVALECQLRLGVQHMTAKQVNSTLHETVLGTYYDERPPLTNNASLPWFNVTPPGTNQSFIAEPYTNSLGGWLYDFATGNYTVSKGSDSSDGNLATSVQVFAIHEAMSESPTGFQDTMDRIAASLTYSLRTAPNQPPGAKGMAYSPESRYKVAFEWLLFPFALLVVSFSLLMVGIKQSASAKQPAWKNSALATMFHGMQTMDGQRLGANSDMVDEAKYLKVLMVDEEGRRRLVAT